MDITEKSLNLFTELAESAGNWDGEPLFEGSKEQRGNLTQLKQAGLVNTFKDEGCIWVIFTPSGRALAGELGIEL